jgi:hypothetical protein
MTVLAATVGMGTLDDEPAAEVDVPVAPADVSVTMTMVSVPETEVA